ncbi:MAG: thymidine phosphorylase [Clostridia bacterium]|nr:thymidine phosphorylase [Clostridia bacterium]
MRMYDIIHKKREGYELSDEEITYFVEGFTKGEIPDYQASALCMAIFFRGMTVRETVTLTDRMARSGDCVDLSRFGDLTADKHSTGGVGDKTTLLAAPIVASLGGKVAKISGRGLGHTGGTVDKLESIPGFRSSLSSEEFLSQVERVGLAVIGPTGNLTPADKKLYALRDVTATVEAIPLITSSIMSKKLAAGSKNIVLDVKVGSGAFMKTPAQARELAESMVGIGKSCGRNVNAVLSNMNVPLGRAVGNSLEVAEAAEVLRTAKECDLLQVSRTLASHMVALVAGITPEEAEIRVRDAVGSGAAYRKMREWIAAQGGDVSYIDDPSLFPKTAFAIPFVSGTDGFIRSMNAELIGDASVVLGAGRASKDDVIDHAAGITLERKTGDEVKRGDVIMTLYTNRENAEESALEYCRKAVVIGSEKPEAEPLIYEVIR